MSGTSTDTVTALLERWRSGDKAALGQLIPLLYTELRKVAIGNCATSDSNTHSKAKALVHEAYLRLVDQQPAFVENRNHFIGIASTLMRQVLVDHARQLRAAKRDGGCRIDLTGALDVPLQQDVDVVELDDALNALAALDARQARIVEMRFFGGLSIEDTARVIEISPATVKREWVTARAWLTRELGPASTT